MSQPDLAALEDLINLGALGERLCHWHSSMGDPIYAVGSFANIGKVHPNREVVDNARNRVEFLLGRTEEGDGNYEELIECLDDLDTILNHWPVWPD